MFGLLVAAGYIGDGQRVLENFATAGELVVRQKKKVSLVLLVGRWHISDEECAAARGNRSAKAPASRATFLRRLLGLWPPQPIF